MMTRPSTLLLLHAARALLGLRSSRPKTLRQVSTLESPKTATRRSGLSFLPPSTIKRAEAGNPIEKNKLKKGGDAAWTGVYDFAAQIRAGTLDYDQIEDFDINQRLKWVGMLSRFKKTLYGPLHDEVKNTKRHRQERHAPLVRRYAQTVW